MRIVVRFPPRSLRTNHAGLDLAASAQRYRDFLEPALASALAPHSVEVVVDDAVPTMSTWCSEGEPADAAWRAIERDVLDHAWVVRQMSDWPVVG